MNTLPALFTTAAIGQQPLFETERFTLVPLSPAKVRELAEMLLQDEALASQIPWLEDKSRDGAAREACGMELQAAAGQLKAWGVIARELRMHVGMIFTKNSLAGIDVEVLVASQFGGREVADEAGDPVLDWLDDHAEVIHEFPAILH